MADIAQRFAENPILRPSDVRPSAPGMKVECLLNPGVFRFQDKTWLLLRASGTEPLLRVYCESCSVESVAKVLEAAQAFVLQGSAG